MNEQLRFKTDKVVVETATEDLYTTGVIRRCLATCLLSSYVWLGNSKDSEFSSDDDDDKPLICRQNQIQTHFFATKVRLRSCPLRWGKEHAIVHKVLASVARKYLASAATSVPSERVLCQYGTIFIKKRASQTATVKD